MEVTLGQILAAREERVWHQQELSDRFGCPLISFSMNIPGPVKDTPLIRRGFEAGLEELERRLPEGVVLHREVRHQVTGCEALYAADLDPARLKAITTRIEDTHGLGRLFDMDVMDAALKKLDRESAGGKSRDCIVCGAPGRGCASRRIHPVQQLQQAVKKILTEYFRGIDAQKIGALAVRALLDEVYTTPKPGLVDRNNSGSHRDMNLQTFCRSALALEGYFRDCAEIGMDTSAENPGDTFRLLREAGLRAEQTMYRATGGVNTHKGAVFTLGILCGAAGRLWDPCGEWKTERLLKEVAAMTREEMENDLRQGGSTPGLKLYARYGIRGIRGEAARGLPAVQNVGLVEFQRSLQAGLSRNDAGVRALLALITAVEDTNMLRRGGPEEAKRAAQAAGEILKSENWMEQTLELDKQFIRKNLSPGGCADLLAAVYFLHSLTG